MYRSKDYQCKLMKHTNRKHESPRVSGDRGIIIPQIARCHLDVPCVIDRRVRVCVRVFCFFLSEGGNKLLRARARK